MIMGDTLLMSWNRVVRAVVLLGTLFSASWLTVLGQLSAEVYSAIVMAILALFHKGMEENE